jgi:hypothetical protein
MRGFGHIHKQLKIVDEGVFRNTSLAFHRLTQRCYSSTSVWHFPWSHTTTSRVTWIHRLYYVQKLFYFIFDVWRICKQQNNTGWFVWSLSFLQTTLLFDWPCSHRHRLRISFHIVLSISLSSIRMFCIQTYYTYSYQREHMLLWNQSLHVAKIINND